MTSWALTTAAILCLVLALGHSYLGERYILIRLFRRENLPHLFGSDVFTKRTLRFAWHITSVAWLGFGALLLAQATGNESPRTALRIVAWTFAAHAIVTLLGSRGRHLAWVVFAAVASAAAWSSSSGSESLYDNGVSDSEYLSIAQEHPDAQAFLTRHPQPGRSVDRSGGLAVDFRAIGVRSATNPTRDRLRLRVLIDPDTDRPIGTLFDCDNRIVTEDVRASMERYWSTGECPAATDPAAPVKKPRNRARSSSP